ncbi:PREDICTED: Ycf2 [Prunus dulcis]|uniref:Protein Ycf2 n=1 Tax=Prunus dulcis TaxID=3755 RepID=A0A5E4F9E9_PRUDU|nr:PREDICTED: Ycf2 [Prunus dulcis]
MIHRNNESSLISTHLRLPNIREFLYSILLLLLVARNLVRTHLLFVSRAYSELQTEFERVKSFDVEQMAEWIEEKLERRMEKGRNRNLQIWRPSSHWDPYTSQGDFTDSSLGTGLSYLVKYLATNSYVAFITVFLNKFLENKPKGFLVDDSDDIDDRDDIDDSDDCDFDRALELLTMMNALTMDMMP